MSGRNKTREGKHTVSIEELAISNMWEIDAIANLLDQKGLISKEEILAEIKRLKDEHDRKIN